MAAIVRRADLVGFQDGVDAFLLGGIDEGTGVNDHNIGGGGIVRNLDSAFNERAEHDFGIDKIFGAAEGNKPHAHRLFLGFRHRADNLRDAAKAATTLFLHTPQYPKVQIYRI